MKRLIDNNTIEYVHTSFSFLEKDCGYIRTERYMYSGSVHTRSNYVITYTNAFLKKQIDIALLLTNELVEIALIKFLDDGAIPYNDENYCLSYTKLFYLLNPPVFEQITYSYSESDRMKIIYNAANILMHFKDVICSNAWFDIEKIHRLYQDYDRKKWGNEFRNKKKIEPPSDVILRKLISLTQKGYHLKHDSNNLPFYARNGWFVTYSNGEIEITISQIDMRDYMDYNIDINGIKKTLYYPDYNSAEKLADYAIYFINEHI